MKSILIPSRLMPLLVLTGCLWFVTAIADPTLPATQVQQTSQTAVTQPATQAPPVPPTHLTPLALGRTASTPWSFSPAWFVLLALGMPAMAWFGLAWKRALDADPHRLRRSGVRELRRLLARVRRDRSSPRPLQLHGWCRAAARTWGVRVSAPTPQQVTQSMQALTGDGELTATWRELWSTTERSLYGADPAPPADWLERTSAAAARVQIPKRTHWLPDRLSHWFPSAVAVLLTLLCALPDLARADQAPGKEPQLTAGAETAAAPSDPRLLASQPAAQQALRANWNDWAAHYNVAAYDIQQGQWDLAVAHASAAFLQHPSSEATRDNLRFALQQTGTMDPTLRRLLYGAWYQRIPALLSPAGWQQLALAASVLLGAGLTALIVALYLPDRMANRRYLLSGARGGLAMGAGLLLTSIIAWNAYGSLNRADAGILVQGVNLSPVPTDLVTEQETSPLFAGSVVLPRSSFLSWRQIAFGDNNPGWVRASAVMPFYASAAR